MATVKSSLSEGLSVSAFRKLHESFQHPSGSLLPAVLSFRIQRYHLPLQKLFIVSSICASDYFIPKLTNSSGKNMPPCLAPQGFSSQLLDVNSLHKCDRRHGLCKILSELFIKLSWPQLLFLSEDLLAAQHLSSVEAFADWSTIQDF